MPIIRYLVFAGAFVMALLIVLGGYLTPLEARSATGDVDRSIIRIRSARNLPEKIVFDTTTRTVATVSSPLLALEPPNHAARDALAMTEVAAPETKSARRARSRNALMIEPGRSAPSKPIAQGHSVRRSTASRCSAQRPAHERQMNEHRDVHASHVSRNCER